MTTWQLLIYFQVAATVVALILVSSTLAYALVSWGLLNDARRRAMSDRQPRRPRR